MDILESVPTQLQINEKAEIEKRTMIDCYNCKRYESDEPIAEAWWLVSRMDNYCVGYNEVEYNGKWYYTVHHA